MTTTIINVLSWFFVISLGVIFLAFIGLVIELIGEIYNDIKYFIRKIIIK